MPLCGTKSKYLPKDQQSGAEAVSPLMDIFKNIQEPQLSELVNYVRQRREHVHLYMTSADIKAEVLRNVTETIQPVDQYPKGRVSRAPQAGWEASSAWGIACESKQHLYSSKQKNELLGEDLTWVTIASRDPMLKGACEGCSSEELIHAAHSYTVKTNRTFPFSCRCACSNSCKMRTTSAC